jgi:hypothetical protein
MPRAALAIALFVPFELLAQITGTISGTVVDATGAPVAAARVSVEAQSGLLRSGQTDDGGQYQISNLPLQSYRVSVSADGFDPAVRAITIQSNIPVPLDVRLSVASQTTNITVEGRPPAAAVEPTSTGTRSELDIASLGRTPVSPAVRGLEAVLLSVPGFAADANGAIHPRGAHNQMTYVIDGMPVTDQLTGAFANAVDASIVETVDLFTGNVPAEFGSKVSGVAVITTRSGIGSERWVRGSLQQYVGQFDTVGQVAQFTGGNDRFGYFTSANVMKSHRYLDQVSIDNLHNGGDSERAFTRLDWLPSSRDQIRVNLMAGRSSFELANLRSQQAMEQDQRQMLKDFSAAVGWVRTLGPRTTIDSLVSFRTAVAQLFPSAGDTPVTAAQDRHLTTVTTAIHGNRQQGRQTLRGGGECQMFAVSESFGFGVTDARFNDPGSISYIPTLAAFDLSRGGKLFQFAKKASGKLCSGFGQDVVRAGPVTLSLGLRYDVYRFLARGNQLQPRIGIAYHIARTSTVLRASYNRTYQTPPNENLLLTSANESAVLVPAAVRESLGAAFLVIRPERQNVYEVGLQQGLGSHAKVDASYYHKDSTDLQDNDNFFNTGIIFPTSLARARTNGAELRVTFAPSRALNGWASFTHYHTVVTPPFTGGLFLGSTALNALTAGPFVIDHDQKLGISTGTQYSVTKNLWVSGTLRFDSGLVTNPSDPVQVAADPDYRDLLPYVDLNADVPRVRPHATFDVATGYEWRKDDRKTWEAAVQVSNIGNTTALYNFQSIFVGTRLLQPRTATVRLKRYF